LRDTRPSAAKNRAFLTFAIPGNFALLSTRRLPLPVNSARLRAKQALGAKDMKSEKVREKMGLSIDGSEVRMAACSPPSS
jgi:hypothetical protein